MKPPLLNHIVALKYNTGKFQYETYLLVCLFDYYIKYYALYSNYIVTNIVQRSTNVSEWSSLRCFPAITILG